MHTKTKNPSSIRVSLTVIVGVLIFLQGIAWSEDLSSNIMSEVKRIQGKFPQGEPSSAMHRNNPRKMVWSTKIISKDVQDSFKPRKSFKLTDPIFGRIYLEHSLGNTPIYSQNGDSEPSENTNFGYEFKLMIDGQEKTHKFGVFSGGKFPSNVGETWTSWQFAPNPVPFDESFSVEAEAWRKATSGLAAGTHEVRFELWGVQGSYRTRQPMSVGEFSLVVGEGDRVVSGVKFPSDTYRGSDLKKIKQGIMRVMEGSAGKSTGEVLTVAVTSDWEIGIYNDSKRQYRTIRGAILWNDNDGDGYFRFTSCYFVSNHQSGDKWEELKFKSYSMGGPEGDVEYP